MFCRHKWEVVSETVTKSKFESSIECHPANASSFKIPHQLSCAERKHIQVISCGKCGKLKRFVERI